MGKSIERDGLFGKYTEHYDDEGKKIGESREYDGAFGKYTEHYDDGGKKIGESREHDGAFGKYTEHCDDGGKKIGESREYDGTFGKYKEHSGEFYPQDKSKNADSSKSSSKNSVIESNGSSSSLDSNHSYSSDSDISIYSSNSGPISSDSPPSSGGKIFASIWLSILSLPFLFIPTLMGAGHLLQTNTYSTGEWIFGLIPVVSFVIVALGSLIEGSFLLLLGTMVIYVLLVSCIIWAYFALTQY